MNSKDNKEIIFKERILKMGLLEIIELGLISYDVDKDILFNTAVDALAEAYGIEWLCKTVEKEMAAKEAQWFKQYYERRKDNE